MQRLIFSIVQHATLTKLLALFLLLTIPMVYAPFFTDDFFQLLMLSTNPPLPRPADGSLWGLFSFIDNSTEARHYLMQQGVLPWWTGENFYFKFWRPAAELTHWIDYQLAPGSALVAHLHSLLWFVALSLVVFRIYCQLTADAGLAFLALAIFVLDGNHAPTIEWVANRNALVSGFFAALTLYFHILYRERQSPGWYWLAVVMLGVALTGGEAALAIGAFLFAYAVCLDRQGAVKGFVVLLPYAVVVVLWFVLYKALGYGANGSAIHYVDVASMPGEFALVVLERVPAYLFSAFWLAPAELFPAAKLVLSGHYYQGLWIFAVLVLAFLAFLVWPYFRRLPLLRFAMLAAVLAIVPFCAVISQDRLALIPSIGFDLAIAIMIYRILAGRDRPSLPAWQDKTVRVVATLFFAIHLLLAPLLLFLESAYIAQSAKKTQSGILKLDNRFVANKQVVILKGSLTDSALLKPVRLVHGVAAPDKVWLLSGAKGSLVIERIGANSWSMVRDIGFVEGFEQSFRDLDKLPFAIGDAIELDGIKIVVTEINAIGQPVRIECYLADNIDSGRYAFFAKDKENGLVPVTIPPAGSGRLEL